MEKPKKLLLLFVLFFFTYSSYSQSFSKGDMVGNLGLGFGWYGYGYGVSSYPTISFSLEKGLSEIENIGPISLGGIVGWKHASYSWNYSGYNDTWAWNDYVLAARGALHFNTLKISKMDIYAGMALGVRIESRSYNDVLSGSAVSGSDTYGLLSFFAGARYFFTPKFAGYGEIGYGLGYFTLGVSYKF